MSGWATVPGTIFMLICWCIKVQIQDKIWVIVLIREGEFGFFHWCKSAVHSKIWHQFFFWNFLENKFQSNYSMDGMDGMDEWARYTSEISWSLFFSVLMSPCHLFYICLSVYSMIVYDTQDFENYHQHFGKCKIHKNCLKRFEPK